MTNTHNYTPFLKQQVGSLSQCLPYVTDVWNHHQMAALLVPGQTHKHIQYIINSFLYTIWNMEERKAVISDVFVWECFFFHILTFKSSYKKDELSLISSLHNMLLCHMGARPSSCLLRILVADRACYAMFLYSQLVQILYAVEKVERKLMHAHISCWSVASWYWCSTSNLYPHFCMIVIICHSIKTSTVRATDALWCMLNNLTPWCVFPPQPIVKLGRMWSTQDVFFSDKQHTASCYIQLCFSSASSSLSPLSMCPASIISSS